MREYSDILGPVDSAFYYIDRPETPMNIGSLVLFEGKIDYGTFFQFISSRIHLAPRYRQRIVQAPFNLGQPTWIDNPDFYIGNHIKHVTVDSPGGEAELRKLCDRLLSRMLDRNKPLWEVHFIDGLPDQTGLFFKVHHCMVDGLAAVELFTFLMDLQPEYQLSDDQPLFDPHSLPTATELTLDSILRDFNHHLSIFGRIGAEAARLGGVLLDSDKRLKMLVAAAHLINNNLKPIRKLPINGKNTGRQTLCWSEFSLQDVHAIRSMCGASVNDVMLAVLTRAVERYTEQRGGTAGQSFLRVLVPVNIRSEEEKGQYGNRISVLPVDAPFNITDSLEHLAAVKHFSQVMKESSLSYSMDLILTLPSLMPAPLQSPIWGAAPTVFSLLAHTWCTNVAAMPIPVYLLGHELKHIYGYFPLNPTMGLAAVIVSYNGRISMTLVADKGIIDCPDELERYLREAFEALRTAAHLKESVIEVNVHVEQTIVEVISPEGVSPISSNGTSPNGHVTAPVLVAVEETVIAAPTRCKLFSNEWAEAMKAIVNQSHAYYQASTGWTAGSLAFVLNPSPRHGFDQPTAVLLELHRGKCRDAYALSAQEALQKAAFVIQGDYAVWMEVLGGKASPLAMLTSGKLQLKKGSMLRLLPYTRSATELVRCAQSVQTI